MYKQKISFADFISKEINDIDENKNDDVDDEVEHTSISINIDDIINERGNVRTLDNNYDDIDEDRNENENNNGNNNENNKINKSNSDGDVPLSDFQEFLRSQSESLCVLIAGRIGAISTLRFSTPDTLHLCFSIVKV